MKVGVPKEIMDHEHRVAIVPSGVSELIRAGHQVWIEKGAGEGSGIEDGAFARAGARIVPNVQDIYGEADLLVKVKEPLEPEYDLLREGQILFTFLHLAFSPKLARVLLDKHLIGIGCETVQLPDGSLPLLVPMSEIAGRLAVQKGIRFLERLEGGRGILLGGMAGVRPGKVVIIGGGIVGTNAAKMALALGGDVTLLDVNISRLRYVDDLFQGRLKTLISQEQTVADALAEADLVIGAVLVPGGRTPRVVTREMVKGMPPGTVIVDVAIDQGGCVETSRPTSHSSPTFMVEGVIHYCVTNLPAAVSRTATFALSNVTFPYLLNLANKGYRQALLDDPALSGGLNLHGGKVTHPAVALSLGLPYQSPLSVLTEDRAGQSK